MSLINNLQIISQENKVGTVYLLIFFFICTSILLKCVFYQKMLIAIFVALWQLQGVSVQNDKFKIMIMVGLSYMSNHSWWLACSLESTIWVSSKKSQKSNIGWPQQPPTEKVPNISEKLGFWWSIS